MGKKRKKNYVNFPNICGISERLNRRYRECFKAHDNMYGVHRQRKYPQVRTRLQADDLMYECLIRKECPKLLARTIYLIVRCFGARCWNKHGVPNVTQNPEDRSAAL